VKIESGAKSALDPHEDLSIVPYVSEEVPQLGLRAETSQRLSRTGRSGTRSSSSTG
jgi:hypothetical protein